MHRVLVRVAALLLFSAIPSAVEPSFILPLWREIHVSRPPGTVVFSLLSIFLPPFLWPPLLLANPPFNPAFPALDPIPVPVPLPPSPPRFLPTTFSAPSDIVALIMVDICRPRATFCSFRAHARTHAHAEMDIVVVVVVDGVRTGIDIRAMLFIRGDEAYRALLYRASFSASKARFSSLARFLFTLFLFSSLFFSLSERNIEFQVGSLILASRILG